MKTTDEASKAEGRPFFAFGWVAASGTIVVSMNAAGVVAIGLNAAGSLVAIGGNTVAPISIGGINAVGIVAIGGVNAIGPWGIGGVNAMGSPEIAVGFAVVYLIVTAVLRIRKGLPARAVDGAFAPVWIPLGQVVEQRDVWTRARARHDASRERLELEADGRVLAVRVTRAVARDGTGDARDVFVRLEGTPTPKEEATDYRSVVTEMAYEALELRDVPTPQPLGARIGLLPWSVANTHVLGAVALLAALVMVLAR